MAIKYQARVKGFIVGDVKLLEDKNGNPFFTARAGQERFARLPDGTFKELRNEYFKVLQFSDEATASSETFVPGNYFVATGQIKDRPYTNKEGVRVMAQDFIVDHIELDPNRPQPKNSGTGVAHTVEQSVEQSAAAEELDQAMEDSGPEPEAVEAEPSTVEAQRRLPTVSGSGMSRQQEPVGASAQVPM